jgi:hypothetical protein
VGALVVAAGAPHAANANAARIATITADHRPERIARIIVHSPPAALMA